MARLQSQIWVSAFIRAETVAGAYAVVSRRGAAEAGAIFVVWDHLDGSYSLFGPAPQSLAAGDEASDRLFELVCDRREPLAVRDYLVRQIRFDGDCWIVETERREGRPALVATRES